LFGGYVSKTPKTFFLEGKEKKRQYFACVFDEQIIFSCTERGKKYAVIL